MLDKFNFYDLLGYLLPGATAILILYWIGRYAFGVSLPDLQGDFGASALFIGFSYVVGQLVHGIGSIYEDAINRPEKGKPETGGRLSERLLSENAHSDIKYPFSASLRERILFASGKVFGVAQFEQREIFDQCYALVVQKGLAQHTEIFLALNGLARSMLIVSWIGLLASAALTSKQLILEALANAGVAVPTSGTWAPNDQQLIVGCIAIAGFLSANGLFERAFNRFRMYFATSVYYNFLAWFGEQEFTARLAKP